MSRFAVVLLLLLLASCASSPRGTSDGGELFTAAYVPWWLGDTWEAYDLDAFDELLFFELSADSTGRLTDRNGYPWDWRGLISEAREAGAPVVPTVTLFGKSAFESVFGSPLRAEVFAEQVTHTVRLAGAEGLHLDVEVFESVSPSARTGFTQTVARIREELRRYDPDARLTLFAPALDRADAFDEAALAQYVDYLVVQGYDLHYRGGDVAGPVAPLQGWRGNDWQAIVRRYQRLGVRPEQLVMAVPLYGYEWPTETGAPGAATTGEGRTITLAPVPEALLPEVRTDAATQAERYGAQRDSASGSPYYAFEALDGSWRQGHYEDAASLRAKIAFVQERGLGGVAFFPLGYSDPALLEAVLP